MIATQIDISQLDRHELRALRDEIDFEIQLHDAELRAFYDGALSEPTDDFWCPICEDREGELEDARADAANARDTIDAVLRILTDGSKTEGHRIEEAAEALENEL